MTTHKHAALIAEWIKDTSRVVEYQIEDGTWYECVGFPTWIPYWNYRFAPVKPEVTSTLTDGTLTLIENDAFHRCQNTKSSWAAGRRAIANAACKAERERICALPAVTSLDSRVKIETANAKGLVGLAEEVIAQFQKDLLEGKI